MANYFSYDPDCGFEQHDTAEEARKAAETALDHYRDQAADGWSEEVESICWGEIRGSVRETEREEVPPGVTVDEETGEGSDGNDYSRVNAIPFDSWVDYGVIDDKVFPELLTERPDQHGVAYLKLRDHDGVHHTEADIDCNLDFDEDGELIGVELMSWPATVKQHPHTSQKPQVGSTGDK